MDLAPILQRPRLAATTWGVAVSALDGSAAYEQGAGALLRTASVAKLFLLVEVATRIEDGLLDPALLLHRDTVERVGDSGLWQHLTVPALPVADLARLVGTLSDNWATNALLQHVGIEAVLRRAAALAPGGSALLDRVRDVRGPDDPGTLSIGCAADWVAIMAGLARGEVVSAAVSHRVLDWLAGGADLSMVGGAFGLDPLAHVAPDRGLRLWSKTGTDTGVRADVGVVTGPRGGLAYAVICNWEGGEADPRDEVLAALRDLGAELRASCG